MSKLISGFMVVALTACVVLADDKADKADDWTMARTVAT